ncbi:MAG: DNA cytosine methyltransferase [Deltaproteobacteria bacterium]|jgi:DNA (cytosine-5)-methyltransferase 1|nr:DNA cytosine methyltransferase [Deltaproteobacteria bacterium]
MISVYDFFSGCGGASSGFKAAGLNIQFGLDIDPDAAATFRLNFPSAHFLQNDIRNVQPKELESYINPKHKTLFCGCAPCQPFSKQNKRKYIDDGRTNLPQEFCRFIKYYKPDFIFVENVPGMQSFRIGNSPLEPFLRDLEEYGYINPQIAVLSAADYGVPQYRKRLIIIAALRHDIAFPTPTHGEASDTPYSTVGDWIAGLPVLKAGEVNANDPDHCAMKLSSLNLIRIGATPEGGGRADWPSALTLECHKSHSGHTDVYGRLAYNKPSCTLTTKCYSYSNGRYGHPFEDRALSIREAACLQTFPRSFAFMGTMTSKARQVGNAVPPLLSQQIGKVFKELDR